MRCSAAARNLVLEMQQDVRVSVALCRISRTPAQRVTSCRLVEISNLLAILTAMAGAVAVATTAATAATAATAEAAAAVVAFDIKREDATSCDAV